MRTASWLIIIWSWSCASMFHSELHADASHAGEGPGHLLRVDALLGHESHYWDGDHVRLASAATALEDIALIDPADPSLVEPAQMLAPQPAQQSRIRLAQRSTTASRRGTRTPYMIGDTVAGTCTTFSGLLIEAELSHPSLACSRLNISENNSPLPVDRVYMSYRHFHNAQKLRIFQFEQSESLDRFTLGGEHTFGDGVASVEVRMPIEGRTSSDLFSDINDGGDGDGFHPFIDPRRTELGNISTIFKLLLHEDEEFACSCGLGVTWPTAQDFHYQATIFTTITFPDDPALGGVVTTDRDVFVDLRASNETIYLAPFVAWLYTPQDSPRFFHQGFLQVEAAANNSTVKIHGDGFNVINFPTLGPVNTLTVVPAALSEAELFAQTLLRLNLGIGCTLHENPADSWLKRLIGLAELHYTSTLNDANFTTVTELTFLTDFPFLDPLANPVVVGNAANRVDILNAALGVTAEVGNLVVTNGFVAPIRSGADRGFDFEYNLQVQRPF